VRTLRQLAGKEPRARIARALRRSPAAVTFKAFKLRLSLRVRDKARRAAVAARGKANPGKTSPLKASPAKGKGKAAAAGRKGR
jgi:hypothetical protein